MSPTRKPHSRSLPVLHDDPRPWEVKVAVALVEFHGRLERHLSEELARHGTTLAQFDALMTLCLGEGLTQQDLAERLLVTKANVVGLIDRMEAAGLVERRPDPDDRRVNRIYLTVAGRRLARAAKPGEEAVLKGIFGRLSQDELRQLHGMLARLNAGCSEAE
ncbi:putative HTH-type transcriptional regulator [Aquisphaera giovannonii]|uniref:Putative HTH-type transcriptional regulator n=1 Tax=Aquisphaera giovannonii TaxID=406548 RepID=A0A5B9W4T9_9BACT|nr:MarR family transcriptional regulator [Aquisphaera giovannonii]QEH35686.1 putative HTH-type transcriptional regulator [Aquisphaera giovannonii]